MKLWKRGLRFYAVGAAGIVVQLAALALLRGVCRLPILPATALAIEAAILHNFFWHQRWTWADRRGSLLRFHLASGLVSLLAGVPLTALLPLHYLAANAASIAICSLLNFLLGNLVVFPGPTPSACRRSLRWSARE